MLNPPAALQQLQAQQGSQPRPPHVAPSNIKRDRKPAPAPAPLLQSLLAAAATLQQSPASPTASDAEMRFEIIAGRLASPQPKPSVNDTALRDDVIKAALDTPVEPPLEVAAAVKRKASEFPDARLLWGWSDFVLNHYRA